MGKVQKELFDFAMMGERAKLPAVLNRQVRTGNKMRATLMHSTCNGEMGMKMGEMAIGGKIGNYGKMMTLLNDFVNEAVSCRAPGTEPYGWESRWKLWSPLFWMTALTTAPAGVPMSDGNDPASAMMEAPDDRMQLPDTCSSAQWRNQKKCQLKFTGFSRFFGKPVDIFFQATSCGDIDHPAFSL